jgi:8-oxo-dGTP pyrophosphatase MutT (NUDIX family)
MINSQIQADFNFINDDFSPRTCFTASGCLIHRQKVLLILHKKLGLWLNPGGHLEPGELPHQAAEREFYEETGVFVEAVLNQDSLKKSGSQQTEVRSYFAPNPISSYLHWISEQNYLNRISIQKKSLKNQRKTGLKSEPHKKDPDSKSHHHINCEQHFNLLYLVKPLGTIQYQKNESEVSDIGWFSQNELSTLNLLEDIKLELENAFKVSKSLE